MILKTMAKLERIIEDYRNGNRSDAATAIRKLSKIQLAELLVELYLLKGGFIGEPSQRYDFERFVLRALEGWNE